MDNKIGVLSNISGEDASHNYRYDELHHVLNDIKDIMNEPDGIVYQYKDTLNDAKQLVTDCLIQYDDYIWSRKKYNGVQRLPLGCTYYNFPDSIDEVDLDTTIVRQKSKQCTQILQQIMDGKYEEDTFKKADELYLM